MRRSSPPPRVTETTAEARTSAIAKLGRLAVAANVEPPLLFGHLLHAAVTGNA